MGKNSKGVTIIIKLYNMKMTVIPTVIDILGTIPKGLVKGLEWSKSEDK